MTFSGKKYFLLSLFFGVSILAILIGCKKEHVDNEIAQQKKDSIKKIETEAKIQDSIAKSQIKYSAFIFPEKKKDSAMSQFLEQYSENEQYAILALNRLDQKNRWRADTLVIPNKIDSTLMSYSPFPKNLVVLKNVKKFVLFSYPIQAYAVYSEGNLQKWGPTSMGKKSSQTLRGLHFSNWKKEIATSTIDSNWKLPYNFNIENKEGIGWHQYDLPGFPASHACLRLLLDDAKWLYNYADQWILNKGGATIRAKGTPVIVFGDFDWDGRKPWKNLLENAKANDISEKDLEIIIEPFLEKILKEQQNREEVLAEIAKENEAQKIEIGAN